MMAGQIIEQKTNGIVSNAEFKGFHDIEMAPADPILSLSVAFREDSDENKVNLGIGAYRDDDGKPYVFKAVRIAEKRIADDHSLDKEY